MIGVKYLLLDTFIFKTKFNTCYEMFLPRTNVANTVIVYLFRDSKKQLSVLIIIIMIKIIS